MKVRFDLHVDNIAPDALISLLLTSPVDLLWNGGIGTYVKAAHESHVEVGDKANDNLRVNANELRCKVIGEGGNLGITQAARIEYGLHNGVSLTDFIDNSAGVDCSDHEVNIKILLNKVVAKGGLTPAARNKVLASMTNTVSKMVLSNNYHQVQAIGLAYSESKRRVNEYTGLLNYLENFAGLNRELETLPNEEQMEERISKGDGFTRPELSVMTSYIKMYLKTELVKADYIHDDYLLPYLYNAFPAQMQKNYLKELKNHQLRPEIVATQLANRLINLLGPNFIYRLAESTGASVGEIVKAAIVAKDIFKIEAQWLQIEALDFKVAASVQNSMMSDLMRLMRRTTRWLLRNRRNNLDLASSEKYFAKSIAAFKALLPEKLPAQLKSQWQGKYQQLIDAGVPKALASDVATAQFWVPLQGITEIAKSSGVSHSSLLEIYYKIGDELKLNGLNKLILDLAVNNHWQALARETFQDDLEWQQCSLTQNIISNMGARRDVSSVVDKWSETNRGLIQRSQHTLSLLQRESNTEYPMLSVALRELLNLAQNRAHCN